MDASLGRVGLLVTLHHRVDHALHDHALADQTPHSRARGLEIAELETEVLQNAGPQILEKIIAVKKEVVHLKQIIGPQRDVLARFARGEFKLIRGHLVPYYRDVYDGLYHIGEIAQGYSDSLSGILQIYLNVSSNKTGEVVKVLTMITIITTPLMIVGTWYGMNFKGMPEIDHPRGYLLAIVLTLVTTGLTFIYFRGKRWL